MVKLQCVGIGELTDKLAQDPTTGEVLVPIGVLKHSPSKVAHKITVDAYMKQIEDYADEGLTQAVPPHIGKFHFGLIDVELGCHM